VMIKRLSFALSFFIANNLFELFYLFLELYVDVCSVFSCFFLDIVFFPTIILRMQVMDMFVQCYPIHMENVYVCLCVLIINVTFV
jgi:hypothetical protein